MELKELVALRMSLTSLAGTIFMEKNKEYAAGTDALDNFYKAGAQYKVHPQLVLGIFMDKQLASIRSHIASRQADEVPGSTEPFQNRIADAINYLLFLYALEVDHLQKEEKAQEELARVGVESNLLGVEVQDV